MIGSRLGRWVLDQELGRGGMGQVYLAHADPAHLNSPSQAAVKVLAAELATEAGFLLRFQREIDALSQLNHPQIVRFYESGEVQGRYYYAMEYVPGPSLESRVHEVGRLPWQEVVALGMAICPALKHAHDRGIIHRDLKPSNILLQRLDKATSQKKGEAWMPKITDFGIAHVFARPHLTVTGGIIGTAEYLSPEQAAGKPVTKRSDLYSLGVVFYTILTGRTPYTGDAVELLHKHRFGQYEQIRRLVPEVPHDVEEIVCQLLAKEPEKRQGDAMALYKQFDRLSRKEEKKADKGGLTRFHNLLPAHLRKNEPGPATLMSKLMREELEHQNRGGPVNRFLNQPWVLALLFTACLGLLIWGLWPVSAERLYSKAEPFMNSDDPDDWRQARDLIEKLEAACPNHPYQDQVAAFQRKWEEHKTDQKTDSSLPATKRLSEAQWFYYQGLRFKQKGDEKRAKKYWQELIESFKDIPAERTWVLSAERELAELRENSGSSEDRWAGVRSSLSRARTLKNEGKNDEALAIYNALLDLYRDDPSAKAILAEIENDKNR
jgi:serine/threonine-protein kinase